MINSKLPEVGTTIFTVMSAMAAECGAINLSQGYPDFDGPDYLLERLQYHLTHGANQYAPMAGVAALREAIAGKYAADNGMDPDSEVTVMSGATEALFAAISAFVSAGDEVIMFDPAYDSYRPAVQLMGGVPVHIPLIEEQGFAIDFDALQARLSNKTRILFINTPHNPSGAVISKEDLDRLAALLAPFDTLLLSDEVYEHMVYDNAAHFSVMSHPQLRERSIAVSSFGKTYHVTGWKIAYTLAPPALTKELRKLHQYITFSTFTPAQLALADMLREQPEHHRELPGFYQRKRDYFLQQMRDSRFEMVPSAGTYFQLARYDAISDMPDTEFCEYLTREVGVAAIPLSVFCQQPMQQRWVRFCFAKNEETLQEAAEKLCRL
jgi:methionine aminotransferase